jgi:integrase
VRHYVENFHGTDTSRTYWKRLSVMVRDLDARTIDDLTDEAVTRWCAGNGNLANNTVRGRITAARSFLSWCADTGHRPAPMGQRITRQVLRRFPATYGKKQSANPARWLTKDEAFGLLLGTCDTTVIGLRNQLVMRLALAGMRVAEIHALNIGNLHPGVIHWTGKGNQPRSLTISPKLAAALDDYLGRYATAIGKAPGKTDPLLCAVVPGKRTPNTCALQWGTRIGHVNALRRIVQEHAVAAGLGHVTPHDLRRTAAGILHHDTDDHGAHHFDLLDIQRVLGHADPATTMRSYLDPMDTDVLDRAATVLD